MLTNKIVRRGLANRMQKWDFSPLSKEASYELVQKIVEKSKLTVYEGIEKDVYELTNGNPHYISTLFAQNKKYDEEKGKAKSFASKKEMEEAFLFEATHEKGTLFNFWEEHLQDNIENLNNDPEGQKGLTFKILYYLAEKRKKAWEANKRDEPRTLYTELTKKFKITEELLDEKLKQLEKSDFVNLRIVMTVAPLTDIAFVFALVASKNYYLLQDASEETKQKEFRRLLTRESEVEEVKKDISKLKKKNKEIEGKYEKLNKRVKNQEGEMAVKKGHKGESIAKEYIKKKQGDFAKIEIEGKLENIKFVDKKGKQHELDIIGKVKLPQTKAKTKTGKPRTAMIAAEVKNTKTAVGMDQAEKFVNAAKLYQKQEKYNEAVLAFFACKFSKEGANYLRKNKVKLIKIVKE
jgi:hypothetical protein